MAEERFPFEEQRTCPLAGDYSGLTSNFGTPTYLCHPLYLARRQRNIENNQLVMYGESMSHTQSDVVRSGAVSSGIQISSSPLSSSPGRGSQSSSSPSFSSGLLSDPVFINVITKEEYVRTLKEKRKAFVHSNFGNVLAEFYTSLRKDADSSKHCHREISFEIPEHFDVDRTEKMLCEYFADNGFKALPEGRKETNYGRIVITIT